MSIIINEYGNPSININKLLFKNTNNNNFIGDTKTKITYDNSGLIINGEDATTADINDSLDRRYVTDEILQNLNTSRLFILPTQLLTDNLNILHNLNGYVKVDFYTSDSSMVIANYERVDDNNIKILLESEFNGYIHIYKIN